MVARVIETGLPLVYLNLLGGQDDQVFDGASFVLNPHGVLTHQMPAFEEGLFEVDLREGRGGLAARSRARRRKLPDAWEADYRTMVLSLGDYMRKAGFSKASARPLGRGGQRACRPPSPATRWAPRTCAA
jgi:NAD+ synthase